MKEQADRKFIFYNKKYFARQSKTKHYNALLPFLFGNTVFQKTVQYKYCDHTVNIAYKAINIK